MLQIKQPESEYYHKSKKVFRSSETCTEDQHGNSDSATPVGGTVSVSKGNRNENTQYFGTAQEHRTTEPELLTLATDVQVSTGNS